ncbi:MAG: hypothetical protein K0R64_1466 [Novosphingobium lindaniclasticum]|jgi:vanillate O-demethylase monooxygenase subunit|uniref:aromatic ring-hydroxylating dioxygenase subunit alpha n=1 Tax=Novosphingobium lindaniclasticum TaxID=1329895 RepID=UPI002409B911|nr:aromatic ring-hydroxylating dioxygenase subunit alpha [Novosphingobium lindaniclasticum]MDF2638482.1 hypothetical protein [Novosphingobium lindaniclasticum]
MNYVRDAWYVAAWSRDVTDKPFSITLLNEPIVIYRGVDGLPIALEDRCVHRLAPLSLGRCEGDNLRCMYHGLLFNREGKVVDIPGQDMIPNNAKVRRYAVTEQADWLWVWLGDPDQADHDLVPNAVGPSDPEFMLACGQLDYNAEARLIHDNLLDFSHLTYVHAESFGATDDWANAKMTTTLLERGVRFERWIIGNTGPRHAGSDDAIVDGYLCYEFVIPGVLLMWSGMFAPGTAEKCGFGQPDRSEVLGGVTSSSQAVVPMTDRTSRYFYNTGPLNIPGNEPIRDAMAAATRMAFEEDRVIIEGQQRIIDLTPEPRMMPTSHDKGTTMFTNLVSKLVKQERVRRQQAA